MKKFLFLSMTLLLVSCGSVRHLDSRLATLNTNVFTREEAIAVGVSVSDMEKAYSGDKPISDDEDARFTPAFARYIQDLVQFMQSQNVSHPEPFRVWVRFYFNTEGTADYCLVRFICTDEPSAEFCQSYRKDLEAFAATHRLEYDFPRRMAYCTTLNFAAGL